MCGRVKAMTEQASVKEPFIRIAKRNHMPFWQTAVVRAIALALSLIVSALVIFMIVKMNPLDVYGAIFDGAFGTERRIWITMRDMAVLLSLGIALAPAFKMKFWNIGAEGQMLMGGCATAACMIYSKNLPTWMIFALMIAASLVAGAVWGVVPAIFKARFNTNETLFTLMMNYVAIQITSYCVALWENPFGSNTVGIINRTTKYGWFPALFGQQYMLNVLIVLGLTIFMYIYLKCSKHGYEIAVVGDSENTARYAGISVNRVIIRTMLLSGAIAGLTGFVAVSGASHTISTNTAGGRGFTAIIIAWLSKFNSFVMIAVTLLLVVLERGAEEIASRFSLNNYASQMITGIILFFILGSEFFINYRLIFRGKSKKEA